MQHHGKIQQHHHRMMIRSMSSKIHMKSIKGSGQKTLQQNPGLIHTTASKQEREAIQAKNPRKNIYAKFRLPKVPITIEFPSHSINVSFVANGILHQKKERSWRLELARIECFERVTTSIRYPDAQTCTLVDKAQARKR